MRIVLDTNILARVVSSPHGPAAEAFDRIRSPHVLVISSAMLTELARVLGYKRIRSIHRLSDDQIQEFVDDLEDGALVVDLSAQPVPTIIADDPDDDLVIATAVAGNADVICTLDRHFHRPNVVEYCRDRAIEIISDAELLSRLRADSK